LIEKVGFCNDLEMVAAKRLQRLIKVNLRGWPGLKNAMALRDCEEENPPFGSVDYYQNLRTAKARYYVGNVRDAAPRYTSAPHPDFQLFA
jgi:hypothetical protein